MGGGGGCGHQIGDMDNNKFMWWYLEMFNLKESIPLYYTFKRTPYFWYLNKME